MPRKAQRKTILAAIYRTEREVEDPLGITGIRCFDVGGSRRMTVEGLAVAARRRLVVLRALL